VHFPPIADLPQQSAQIKLFLETIRDPENSPYTIQPYGSGSLSYLFLGTCWALFDPVTAGKVAMLAIALLWVIAIHLTASVRNRPPEGAVLASLFVFNHLIYWGFYGFAVGWPAFLLWFYLVSNESTPSFSLKTALALLGAGLLLYVSHVLWFVAGVGWLLIRSVAFRTRLTEVLWRLAAIAPVIVLTAIWYWSFRDSSMSGPPQWTYIPILGRISLPWVAESSLGGLQGVVDYIPVTIIIAWIIAVATQAGKNFLEIADRELLLAAGTFAGVAMLLPDAYMKTIMFSTRWVPCAMIMLVLAMPSISWSPLVRHVGALALLALFCAITTASWVLFEQHELSGLQESLTSLPQRSRLLGLDMVRKSELIRGNPFLQQFAYAQILKDSSLNFSFAEFPSSLVVYKNQFQSPWTRNLEWYPWTAKERDVDYFDYVLVNGDELVHWSLRDAPHLTAITNKGKWRLYGVSQPLASADDQSVSEKGSRPLFRLRALKQ